MTALIPPGMVSERVRALLNSLLSARPTTADANTFAAVQTFPAGGIVVGTTKIVSGAGTPEGAVAGPKGSLFLRTDGGASTSLYVKESGAGNTGWVGK